jgi:PAS domain S-box-containing protein
MNKRSPRFLLAGGMLVVMIVLIIVNGYRFSYVRDAQLSRENELKAKVDEYEELLKMQQRRFGIVMDSSPVGAVVCDSRGNITAVNKTLADMLGYKPAELLGKPSSLLVADAFRKTHVEYMAKAPQKFTAQTREVKSHFDGDAKKKDGTSLHVSIFCRGFMVDGAPEFVAFIRPDNVPKEPIFDSLRAN